MTVVRDMSPSGWFSGSKNRVDAPGGDVRGNAVGRRDGGRSASTAGRRTEGTGDDATKASATISTSTGTVLDWISARTDMARWIMFPGRAADGGAPSYDWRGCPFAGEVKDPLNARVTYERSLIAIEVHERRAHNSCGVTSGLGDASTKTGMRTCALRVMRAGRSANGDSRCAGDFFVVYVHGNACDVGDCASEATKIAVGLKSHVIVPEFPGYGVTEGIAHEESVNTVVKATVKYCVKYLHAPQSRIIIMGRSIGTGPATWMARLMCAQGGPPAGLVLQSPFTSIRDIAHRYVGAASKVLLADRWNTAENVLHVECPVLLLHGDLDTVIPLSHSRALMDRMRAANKEFEEEPHLGGSDRHKVIMNLFVQEACDHNTYDVERHVVLPMLKWSRKKMIPLVIENMELRRHRAPANDGRMKVLKPMGCRLSAESFMLKFATSSQREKTLQSVM